MNRKYGLALAALLCTLALVAGCKPPTTPPTIGGGPVTDYASLADDLRAAGATVEPAGEVSQDFFSVKGQVIKVNGADVQVFEYESEAAAQEEADLVSPTGSPIGTTMVSWVETPHFYGAGRLIVLYVGGNDAVTALLEDALGSQFAGG